MNDEKDILIPNAVQIPQTGNPRWDYVAYQLSQGIGAQVFDFRTNKDDADSGKADPA